jgi:hypothetical protein
MGLRDAIRALLDSESDEQDTTGEISEIEDGVADAADEGDGIGEADLDDEGDGEGDEDAADDLGGDEGDEDEGGEGTLGDESQSAEDANLRAQLIAQAEQIETLRNRLAAAGLDDSIAESVDEIDGDQGDTLNAEDEDLTVAAFEDDYAKRQAALAELKG